MCHTLDKINVSNETNVEEAFTIIKEISIIEEKILWLFESLEQCFLWEQKIIYLILRGNRIYLGQNVVLLRYPHGKRMAW